MQLRQCEWVVLTLTAALLLAGCGGEARTYPDLPTFARGSSFAEKTRVVQQWAKDSCHYNPAGVSQLAGIDVTDPNATYADFGSALADWFEQNYTDELHAPPGASYHAAVFTGCYLGLKAEGF